MACLHGLEDESWCAYCKKKGKTKKLTKRANSAKRAPKTSSACKSCKKKERTRGAAGQCKSCAIKSGYMNCEICKQLFLPKTKKSRFCGCQRKNKGKGSVWVVASAGLPSLGRRK